MTITQEQATWFAETFGQIVDNVERAVLGKRHVVELVLTAMLSDGHLLLEDFPGTGKTSLARAIAQTVQGTNTRIQFTPDLLPGDITGISVYDQSTGDFEFHAGPIFANIVLADEINRASPKTQSALLEVMEEGSVTIDGVTRQVGVPVPRDRDPEPGRAGRHLPAARGAARPVHDAGVDRLPRPRLDGADPRRCGRARRRPRADHHARRRSSAWPTSPRRSTSTRSCWTTSPGSSTAPARPTRCGSASACAARSRSRARPAPGPPRTAAPTSTPDDVKALAVRGARAPAHPRPRGGVRRRHAGGRHRPGAPGCRAAEPSRGGRMSALESGEAT